MPSKRGLPNFVNTAMLPPPAQVTVTNVACMTASFTPPNLQLPGCLAFTTTFTTLWNFGDPASGSSNTSTATSPTHLFSSVGTYTTWLHVNYSNGAKDSLQSVITITNPCISIPSQSITCASLGSATVNITGGIGPYSYSWIPTAQTTSVATGLAPGSYTVLVTDAGFNATYTSNIFFTPLIPLTGSISSSSSLTCPGAATGTGQVTNLAGGSGSEFYSWSNGLTTFTTPTVSSLSAGVWTATVTDALTACQISQVFQIIQPPSLVLNLSASSNSACPAGSVIVTGTASGGTPGYSYNWANGPPTHSTTVSEIVSGIHVYSLSATDANTCTITNTIAVDFVPSGIL